MTILTGILSPVRVVPYSYKSAALICFVFSVSRYVSSSGTSPSTILFFVFLRIPLLILFQSAVTYKAIKTTFIVEYAIQLIVHIAANSPPLRTAR
mmetsp:Transcript_26902/g.54442  ORF Transcript_26902/g.54442 Transcript_26902/m.54442 type:complete len:95 (+) Transcript_26902:56-340(+)